MSSLSSAKSGRDPFISAVLDAVLDVIQFDPETVNPYYKLGQDLGASRAQTQIILFRAANLLGLNADFEMCQVEDTSLRQMVEFLRAMHANSSKRSA